MKIPLSPPTPAPRALPNELWLRKRLRSAQASSAVWLRGGLVVPFSSGSGVRVPQRQRKRHQPRRAAPDGASCEKHPRVRPNLVVAPSGAARRRLGLRYRLSKRLSNSASPRRGASARKSPNLVAELCVPPRRGGVGVGRCVSPTSSLGLPTPAPDWFVPCFSQKLPLLVPSGAGRGLKACSSAPPLARPSGRLRRGDM